VTEQGLFVDEDGYLSCGLGFVPAFFWSSFTLGQSPRWDLVLLRTMQRLQCNCANKNALLSCKTEELTAIKINPGQSTLPGSPQVVASACRLFLIRAAGVSGMGCRSDRAYVP